MFDFFTLHPSQAPELTLLGRVVLLSSLLVLGWLVYQLRHSRTTARVFKGLQLVQLVALYSWYLSAGFPLDQSLPLYHCRIAMFALLFLPKTSTIKDYLAFLGLGGVICAFASPVFDPYPVWHVTFFSYVVGHLALWGNALLYLFRNGRASRLTLTETMTYTLLINAGLVLVNHLTAGNYGFLSLTPLLNSRHLLFNYIIVTLANVALVKVVQASHRWFVQKS